eukprot:4366143-Pyramimonas_sp.AAC.1
MEDVELGCGPGCGAQSMASTCSTLSLTLKASPAAVISLDIGGAIAGLALVAIGASRVVLRAATIAHWT